MPAPFTIDDVLLKINKTQTCWLWKGNINIHGYGRIGMNRKNYAAHRVVYRHFKGSVPVGLVLDHLCRVRSCVNPEHLEAVTSLENWRRGQAPSRKYSKRTHCTRGHAYTPENTYFYSYKVGSVLRSCKLCAGVDTTDRRRKCGIKECEKIIKGKSGLCVPHWKKRWRQNFFKKYGRWE